MDTLSNVSRQRSAEERFDEYVSYEDGSALVICDRSETTAWVRSEMTVAIEP